MKATIEQCLTALGALEQLKERTVTGTKELLKAVVIPAEKAKTGYWLGRFGDKLNSISKEYSGQRGLIIKEFGEPEVAKNEKGEDVATGSYKVKAENVEKYKEAIESLLKVEEEISIAPLKYELFEGISFPQEFWTAMIPFISEPEK